jgi:hypothetical protein
MLVLEIIPKTGDKNQRESDQASVLLVAKLL